jgi:hypothetical protein
MDLYIPVSFFALCLVSSLVSDVHPVCYLFDRQISIRTGKAFWSRGTYPFVTVQLCSEPS